MENDIISKDYWEESMSTKNHMRIEFDSKSENESFIRTVIAAFLIGVNPTMEELSDIKTSIASLTKITTAIVISVHMKITCFKNNFIERKF